MAGYHTVVNKITLVIRGMCHAVKVSIARSPAGIHRGTNNARTLPLVRLGKKRPPAPTAFDIARCGVYFYY